VDDTADLRAIADAVRAASTAAYDAGVAAGDNHAGPHRLDARLDKKQ
jgi:hypothetical protein